MINPLGNIKILYGFLLMLILSTGISKAQTESAVKLILEATVCNVKPSIADIVDSTSVDKSIILANQFENTIAFLLLRK